MKWFEGFTEKPGRVLINHGVDTARNALAARLTGELGIPCTLPARDVPIEV